MISIYYLEINNIPFYVGKTINISRRKSRHWFSYGKDITLNVIDQVPENEWKFWESFYIELFKSWGFILENKNNGGGGPTKWTEEQKKNINPDRINKIKNNPDRGKNISKSLENHSKYYTKEIREKISKGNKGKIKIFTEEHLINLAKANLESKGKIVNCFDLNNKFIKSFQCLREAKIWLLKKLPNISINVDKQIKDCCNNRQKTCHGYIFKYKS